jgi:hypothetical protein
LAKKLSISKSVNSPHSLLGISCLANDYRLLYFASKSLGMGFAKLPDLPLYGKTNKLGDFSFYEYYDEISHLHYYLFANKSQGHIAVPAYRHFDYFLLIDESIDEPFQSELLNKLRRIPILQAAMHIPLKSLKNLDHLLEDIELHLIDIQKERKKKIGLWKAK